MLCDIEKGFTPQATRIAKVEQVLRIHLLLYAFFESAPETPYC